MNLPVEIILYITLFIRHTRDFISFLSTSITINNNISHLIPLFKEKSCKERLVCYGNIKDSDLRNYIYLIYCMVLPNNRIYKVLPRMFKSLCDVFHMPNGKEVWISLKETLVSGIDIEEQRFIGKKITSFYKCPEIKLSSNVPLHIKEKIISKIGKADIFNYRTMDIMIYIAQNNEKIMIMEKYDEDDNESKSFIIDKKTNELINLLPSRRYPLKLLYHVI